MSGREGHGEGGLQSALPLTSLSMRSGRKGDMFARMANRVWSRWVSPEHGQDLLEYALLVALIALAAVGAVTSVGTTINTVLWDAIDATTNAL